MSSNPLPPPRPSKPCPNQQCNYPPVASCPSGATSTGSNNSVLLFTGQFTFSIDLLSAPSLGAGSWDFSLNYLAQNGISDLVGPNWGYRQYYRLTQPLSSEVVLTTPENTQEVFTYAGNNQWASGGNNTMATLVELNPGTTNDTFVLTSNNGTVTTFFGFASGIATPGRMKSITDRYGNSQTFTWQNVGGTVQLTGITDAYGRTITYSYYNGQFNNQLAQITDFLGRQLNFQYDTAGRLIAIVLPSINSAAPGNTFPGGTAYVFQYDSSNPDPNRQNDLIKIWYPNQTLPFVSVNRAVDTASVYANATPRYTIVYGQTTGTIAYGRVITETVGRASGGPGGTYNFTYTTSGLPGNLLNPGDPIVSRTIMLDRMGNQKIFDFNAAGMVVRREDDTNRNKSSREVGPYITWTQYNAQNQETLIVYPAGNSTAFTYDSGMIDFGSGPQLYPPRRGLLLNETRYPGNSFGIPSRAGSNGQTQLTKTYFYDPIFNQPCATVEERGNPITTSWGSNVYFTPQNGGTAPTDANRSRYATFTLFDYQKNQLPTIANNIPLQDTLGLTAAQIQALFSYVVGQMTSGGLPNGFQVNLGDINGDGTGDGANSGLPMAAILGSVVQITQPSVLQLVPNTSIPPSGNPWLQQTQNRVELFTNNAAGQVTTRTDAEGNLTVYVRYPENDPEGNEQYAASFLSNRQYGRLKEVHVDANPNQVMDLVGSDGDLTAFYGNIIPRTNTPGTYLDLVTRYEGGSAAGCVTCAYDPLGNPLAITDPRGFTTTYQRTEMGEEYLKIGPAPYNYQSQNYYDANRNVTRTDVQDQQVQYQSLDPSDAAFAHFQPSGNVNVPAATANLPMQPGPGGTTRPGWFTNLFTFDLLDNRIQQDMDATGSDPASLITSFAYDANQNLAKITKPNGNTIEYDYDERNLRIASRIGYAPNANPPVLGAVSITVFDANGNPLNAIGPANRGNSSTSLSCTINNAFGSGNQLTQTGDWLVANTYDGFDRIISVTDAIGNVTSNTFDPGGRTIQSQFNGPANGPTPTNRTGSTNVPLQNIQARFDEASRQYESQQSVFLNTGIANGQPTNNLPSGRSVRYTGGGLAPNSTTNSNTGSVTLTAGGQSYVLARSVFNRADRLIATTTDNGAVTNLALDGAGRTVQVLDPMGNATNKVFDANGNAVQITRTEVCTISEPKVASESFITLNRFDCINQLVLTAQPGPDGSIAGQAGVNLARISLFGFDSRGNQSVAIDARGNTTLTTFDGASRKLQTRQHLRQSGLGANPPVSTGLVGPNGPAGTSFGAAGQGQLAGAIETNFQYDGNSNLAALVDDRGGTTLWAYDTLDRIITQTYHDGSKKIFVYDAANDVVQYADEVVNQFIFTWDPMGRKTNTIINLAPGYGGPVQQFFEYDGLRRVTSANCLTLVPALVNSSVVFAYDSLGRTVEEAPVSLAGANAYITNTAFTSLPATQFTYPNGRQVNWSYDALYRRQSCGDSTTPGIATWQYFGPNRVAEVALGNGIIQTMMNNARTHSAVQLGTVPNPPWASPSSDRLGYDGSGRIIAKRYLAGGINTGSFGYSNTNPVVGQTTAYDPTDNKYYERALHSEPWSFLYQPVDASGNIASPNPGYDSIDRLLQYQRGTLSASGGYQNAGGGSISNANTLPGTNASQNWNLDGLGNWRASNYTPVGGGNGQDQRSHNRLNQITQRTVLGQGGAVNFNYDGRPGQSNGNLISDGTRIYAWDAFNRLIQVNRVSDGAIIAQYFYDAIGRRVRKIVTNGGLTGAVPNETTDYFYLANQCMEEREVGTGSGSGTESPIRQYVWGKYIDECIQLTTLTYLGEQALPPGTYYLLQDTLYRAVALTNSSGSIVEAYDTDAYGNTITYSEPGNDGVWFTNDDVQAPYGANEIIYCGYRYNPETQLYYVRARSYNPQIGRWLQRDPIVYQAGSNLYAYGEESPVTRMDPSGRWYTTVLGPNGPIWSDRHGGCVIYFQRLTAPNWWNCIFGCPPVRTENVYYPLNGVALTQQQCSPGLPGGCVDDNTKAILKKDLADALIAEGLRAFARGQQFAPIEEVLFGFAGGAAGESGAEAIGAGVEGAGNVKGTVDAGGGR